MKRHKTFNTRRKQLKRYARKLAHLNARCAPAGMDSRYDEVVRIYGPSFWRMCSKAGGYRRHSYAHNMKRW